nr:TIM barrel protein [Oceaniglobus trochenteri]
MKQAKEAGFDGWEDICRSAGDVATVAAAASGAGIEMRSAYVPGNYVDASTAGAAIDNTLAVAEALRDIGITRLVVNPDPLSDKGLKSDAQLAIQGRAMDDLGAALRKAGSTLQFHSHAPEMAAGAREFHHMLAGTDPRNVRLCLDVHWVFRGAGDSHIALDDIIRLYGDRVDEVHLRQSVKGIWKEKLGEGDLDFPRIAGLVGQRAQKPLMVIELAYEPGMTRELDPVEAHRQAVADARRHFDGLGED